MLGTPFVALPSAGGARRRLIGQDSAPAEGHGGEGCCVGFFQRDHDVAVGFQVEGHGGERGAHGRRFDPGARGQAGFIGDEGQRFVGRRLERLVRDFAQDCRVDSFRVAPGRRKRVDQQQMDALFQKFADLVDERPKAVPRRRAVFVPNRAAGPPVAGFEAATQLSCRGAAFCVP
jgi:hypothetical protein